MKPMKSLLRTAAFVLSAAPLLAQAALIDITVTGVVYSSYDGTGNVFGQGVGNDIVNDQTAILKFTYDTATAPGDYYGGSYPHYAHYEYKDDVTDWIESSASVGGNAVSDVVTSGNSSNSTYVSLQDYLPTYSSHDYISVRDYEMVNDSGYDSNDNYFYRYAENQNYFQFYDYLENFLNGVALNQTFSATMDGDYSDIGYAYIFRYLNSSQCADPSCNAYQSEYEYSYAYIALNTVTMSLRNTNIPEPGSLALLGLGLSGLAFVRRRKALS